MLAGEPSAGEAPDLTPEAVNAALDEVRPYLIADGGNVEVAGVEDGTVYLRLQVHSTPPWRESKMTVAQSHACMPSGGI